MTFSRYLPILIFPLILAGCAGNPPGLSPLESVGQISRITEPVFSSSIRVFNGGDPAAPTVVLIHGIGNSGMLDWRYLIPQLVSRYHVIALDLPGFAQSDKPNAHLSPDNYSKVIKFLVDRYAHSKVHIVGHSMGGAIALRYASRYPDTVENLVLLDVAGILYRTTLNDHLLHIEPNPDSTASRFFTPVFSIINAITRAATGGYGNATIQNMLYDILRDDEKRRQFFLDDTLAIAAVSLVLENFTPDLPRVKTPTTLIWAVDDQVSPLRTGLLLEHRLANASLQTVEYGGHGALLNQPERINHIIQTALAFPREKPELFPALRVLPTDGAVVSCRDVDEYREFTGHYNAIYINNCENVLIRDASMRYLEVVNSVVNVRNSLIAGSHLGANFDDSIVKIANSHFHGQGTAARVVESKIQLEQCQLVGLDTGLNIYGSIASLSGVDITGDKALVTDESTINSAGVKLKGISHAVFSQEPQKLMFSVSYMEDKQASLQLHGPLIYDPKELR